MSEAACRGLDVNVFYVSDESAQWETLEMAFRICAACPVSDECLEHALKHEDDGVWAGTTPNQRRGIRRELGIYLEVIRPVERPPRNENWHGTHFGMKKHYRRVALGMELGPVTCEPCRQAHRDYERAQRAVQRKKKK
jgi:WhiB family redox-sensing transcriptional regulator